MKTLEPRFEKSGWNHEQVWREGGVAVYKRWHGKVIREGGNCPHFETILVNVNLAWEGFGKFFPETESYPTQNEWGTRGWTYADFETAMNKARELLAQQEQDHDKVHTDTTEREDQDHLALLQPRKDGVAQPAPEPVSGFHPGRDLPNP